MGEVEQLRLAIKTFWGEIERQLTQEYVKIANDDSKQPNYDPSRKPTIFLPHNCSQKGYYEKGDKINIKSLPEAKNIDDQAIFELSRMAGILALAFDDTTQTPLKYVVPGGRFDEFYGWDSYFIARGLLNDGHFDLAVNIADHFTFEIRNYGKILNANRPYYLGRTQPPFLTDLAFKILDYQHGTIDSAKKKAIETKFVDWIKAAILEYESVWKSSPRYDPKTNLSKYFAQGRGIPPEVENGHFDRILEPIAKRHGMELQEFIEKYNNNQVEDEELDTFLKHDRAIRESGHDVTSRLVNVCADLCTIDLCALLYKYETDIAEAIRRFPDQFGPEETVEKWENEAKKTKEAADKYLWFQDANNGYFCDYNVREERQHHPMLCPTTFYSLWSGLASPEQADLIVKTALPRLEFEGGLASTSKLKVGDHDSRQWDYPAGWAPHQILAWEGLCRYGYTDIASRLATKWVKTICKGASNSQGAIFEKYDVTGVDNPQDVRAEYGNQGNNKTGFGWTNASFALAVDHLCKL